jgi:signal transduction histidine kinase/FixJ family two-component response regulator
MISTFDEEPYSEELNALVRKARTRMLFSHVPAGTLTAAGFAVVLSTLIYTMMPGMPMTTIWVWMACVLLVAGVRTHHARRYYKSRDRGADHWYRGLLWNTAAFSVLWGGLIWLLPISHRLDMVATMVGSIAGLAAMGAFMLTVDRLALKLWVLPLLVPNIIYCVLRFDVYGVFGVISLTGFAISLWMESARSHRRVGELLRLRYESEQLAHMQAEALNQANAHSAAKGRFLATMSHEMRTPLHGILGLSRLLRPDLATQDGHHRLNLLQGAGEHLLTVINDVLDFSRLESGHVELHQDAFDLSQLIDEVTALAAVNAQEKGLTVRVDSCLPERYQVRSDAGRLRQVLINLLGNAVKFTDRGEVVLRVRAGESASDADLLSFEVMDTGIGIEPKELGKVFEAFHQVDGAFERRAGGSGLGLSIARQVCQALGSELTCESQPGVGSTFRFEARLQRVPLADVLPMDVMTIRAAMVQHPEWTADLAGLADRALSGHILLVEDNPINALVAQAELEQLGLEVSVATNGVEALNWLDDHQADVILMDCHMPEMNGFEATRRIRQRELAQGAAPVPIIALTANAQDNDRRLCLSSGMTDHLAKPFKPAALLALLRRYLRRSGTPHRTARAAQAGYFRMGKVVRL